MPGKRISELTALSGAGSANNDDVLIFDADAGVTKRISRSQLAEGMQTDVQVFTSKTMDSANNTLTINAKEATLEATDGSRVHEFKDVAALLADTGLVATTGSVVRTRAEGFAYVVAASAATDQHVTTAGGVKLYVQPGASGYNVKAFGAVGNGVVNDTAAFQSAISAAATGSAIYVPGNADYIVGALTHGSKFFHWICENCTLNGSIPSFVLAGAVSYNTGRTTRTEQRLGATSTDVAPVYNYRNANYTGGTGGAGGFVNAGFFQQLDVASTALANEWGILSVLNNSSPSGENVAIFTQGNKKSGAGITWAGVFESRDDVTTNNPTTGLVGIEVDIFANGSDDNTQRVAIDVVSGKAQPGGAKSFAACGLRIGPVNADATSGGYNTGVHLYGDMTRGIDVRSSAAVGADFSSGVFSAAAIRIASGQTFSFDGTDVHRMTLNGGNLQYFNGSTLLLNISDADNTMSIVGPLKINSAQVVTSRRTGWSAGTGTATRAAFATSTVTTAELAERVKALIDDLNTHGLIGA